MAHGPAVVIGMNRHTIAAGETPTAHGARRINEQTLAVLSLGYSESGPVIDLSSGDPEWWEQVAREAAATAKALRELHADPRLTA